MSTNTISKVKYKEHEFTKEIYAIDPVERPHHMDQITYKLGKTKYSLIRLLPEYRLKRGEWEVLCIEPSILDCGHAKFTDTEQAKKLIKTKQKQYLEKYGNVEFFDTKSKAVHYMKNKLIEIKNKEAKDARKRN